jgi:hypothetical protein
LPNPPASVAAYDKDHAKLLVRYMFLMNPDEQRQLLATGPAAPAAAAAPAKPAEHHARSRRNVQQHHRSFSIGARLGSAVAKQLLSLES